MSRIQSQITQHMKNQNLHEKRKSINANAKMIQMWELTHENFKTAIIKILQQASQTLKINRKVEMSRKEIEDLKKNQMDILELKNSITK